MSTERNTPQDLDEIARTFQEAARRLREGSPALVDIMRDLEAAAVRLGGLLVAAAAGERDQVQDLGHVSPAVSRETQQVLSGKHAGAQDLDPHLAERLHQLRRSLGLSVNDMAQRLGLWGANGADNLRQMERCARPLPGTLQVLLGYMEREESQRALREHLDNRVGTKPPYEDLADRMEGTPYRSVAADLSDEQRAELGLPRAKR